MRHIIIALAFGYLTNLLIYGLPDEIPESHMSESINAVLLKCPLDPKNMSCEVQIIISIHMNPSFDVDNMDKFWVLDEVYDPTKRANMKIISPYLIMVSRGEPIVMYPLQYLKSVNQEDFKMDLPEEKGTTELPQATDEEDQLPESDFRRKRSHHPTSLRNKYKGSKKGLSNKRQNVNAESVNNDDRNIHDFNKELPVHNTIGANQRMQGKIAEKVPIQKPILGFYSKINKMEKDNIEKVQAIEHNYAVQHIQDQKNNLENKKEYKDVKENPHYSMDSEPNMNNDQVRIENRDKHFPMVFDNNERWENGIQKEYKYENPTSSRNMQKFDHENGNKYELRSKYIPVKSKNRENYYMDSVNYENNVKKFRNEKEYKNENYRTDENIQFKEQIYQPSMHSSYQQKNNKNMHFDENPESNGGDYENDFDEVDDNRVYENNLMGQSDMESLESIANRHINENLNNHAIGYKKYYKIPHLSTESKYNVQDQYHQYLDYSPDIMRHPKSYYQKPKFHRFSPMRRVGNNPRIKRAVLNPDNIEEIHSSQLAEKRVDDALKMYNLKNFEINDEVSCDSCGGKNKETTENPDPSFCAPLLPTESKDSKNDEFSLKINDEIPCDTCGGKNKKPEGKPLPSGKESEKVEDLHPKTEDDKNEELEKKSISKMLFPPDFYEIKVDKNTEISLSNEHNIHNLSKIHLDEIASDFYLSSSEKPDFKFPSGFMPLDLHSIDESSCDTCGGKNKKPGGKTLPGGLDTDKIQDFHIKYDESSCDTCGGKNKQPSEKPFPGSLDFPNDFHLPFDIYGDHYKNLGDDFLPDVDKISLEVSNEASCDTCGGKNKKPDPKPLPGSLEAEKMQNFHLKLDEEIPCDTCGGKNKKPGGKPGGPKSEHLLESNDELVIPCEKCKGHDNCNDDTLVSETCGCVGNPDVCNCEVSKETRESKNKTSNYIGYSIFKINPPVPVLTTKLRIFRRRRNTWWRIVPIITLNSMNGIYANENISVVFTSHVDILRMEKSMGLLNSKLAIPKKENPGSVYTLKEYQDNVRDSVLLDDTDKDISIRDITSSLISKLEKLKNEGVKKIEGLGKLPSFINTLVKCPHKDKDLCLNVRDGKVPEFSIKIKIPFRENAFLVRDKNLVKIARIVTDATTKDALQISVDVINKGMKSEKFRIFICNCEQSFGLSTTSSTTKLLLPHVGKTVTFLLPFIRSLKKKGKFRCDVVVKAATGSQNDDLKVGVVAKRSMDIQFHSRCFCVWRCQCHCMGALETYINYNVCEKMSHKAQDEAGLLYNCPPGNEKHDICITDLEEDKNDEKPRNFIRIFLNVVLFLLWLLLFLGLLKAILGLCIKPIARYGFDTLQPGRNFECTSKKRIFLINLFFFIIFLFAFWCKCFQPRAEDLLVASTEWMCKANSGSSEKEQCDGQARLIGGYDNNSNDRFLQAFGPLHENGLFADEKPEDEESTLFIMEVLKESKSSLSKMMSQSASYRQMIEERTDDTVVVREAEELVDTLRNAHVVYRILSLPMGGNTDPLSESKYCVKGYFLPSINSTYEFLSCHPYGQTVGVPGENEVEEEEISNFFHTDEFSKIYANKMEVYEAGDLFAVCPDDVQCINMNRQTYLENSFVKLSTQQSQLKTNRYE
ncbi:uncharacterized protein [Drosophila bipectinata]|uniref:uncharacterized protein isoform X2 n=1 Tax=Drosophila bipectinata TaxID=42026 RepID=UPI0038B24331